MPAPLCVQPVPSSPVILSSEILTLSQGSIVQADSYGIQNKTDRAMLIDRFIFSVRANSPDYLGGAISVKLRLGAQDLTNGFVPLCVLTSPYSARTGTSEIYYFASGGLGFTTVLPLAHPLYVAPGNGFSAQLARTTDGSALLCGVNLGFAGCATVERPRKNFVPYISAFSHPRDTVNATSASTSTNTDMQNKFGVSMYVDKFIASGDDTSNFLGINIIESYLTDSALYDFVDIYYRGATRLTNKPHPLNALFWPGQCAVDARMVIAPNDWFITQFTSVAQYHKPVIAMVGYREEALP